MKNILRPTMLLARNNSAVLIFLILLFVGQLATSSALADSQGYLAEKYLGKYDDLKSNGYTIENGISLNVLRKPPALAFAICRPISKENPIDCVFVITEILGYDASGHAIRATPSEMIHINLSKDWGYFDTSDTGCRSSKYPSANIVAIGKWAWRKQPLKGGYAHSLKKAWRIDYRQLRFVEVLTRDVSCGFDDDRD